VGKPCSHADSRTPCPQNCLQRPQLTAAGSRSADAPVERAELYVGALLAHGIVAYAALGGRVDAGVAAADKACKVAWWGGGERVPDRGGAERWPFLCPQWPCQKRGQGHVQHCMAVDALPHSPGWHLQVKDVASQDRGLVQATPIEGVAEQHCCSGSMQVVPHATVPACRGWVPAWVGACGVCVRGYGGLLLCAKGGLARIKDRI
jgi:hypothetical protein